jgi:glycosyltransferase involved in cell wall biosynthesis
VGRLVKWKRVDMIIDAIKQLIEKYPTIELIVVGIGPEEENLKQQTKDAYLEKHIKFVGGVYEIEKLGRYLNESTIYILAGMGGLSINDAMAFGLPVICAVADGTEKKLVRENCNGYYFENGDTKSLIYVIDKMLGDLPKTEQMGIESTRIIKEEINIHLLLDTFKKSFDYVLSHN